MIVRNSLASQVASTTRILTDLKDRVTRQTDVAVSQREVLKPSDAPGEWGVIRRLDDLLRDQGLYIRNTQSADAALSTAEGALSQGRNLLVQARELATQLASETFNDADRAEAASQVAGIRESLLGVANTTFAGRALFAGTAFDGDAFDATGTYLGNGDEASILVGDGVSVRSSLVGDAVFSDGLQALADLEAALASGPGSSDAVAGTFDDLDASAETMVRARQGLGFDLQDANDAAELARSLELTFQQSLNDRVAADPIESLTQLSEMQQAYEVALQASASVASTSLFDFL